MYHASYVPTPPHEAKEEYDGQWADVGNNHPDVIHMGNKTTVNHETLTKRPYIHEYEVPTSSVYPVVFGDEYPYIEMKKPGFDDTVKNSPVKEGLFETISGSPDLALKSNMALPYRNRMEDPGGISHIVPKSLVNQGVARYLGVTKRR